MCYFTREDVPFHYSLADSFTVCDQYFSSSMTPTDPNRLHLFTGMIDIQASGNGPLLSNTVAIDAGTDQGALALIEEGPGCTLRCATL